jgi:RND superfamily putative drug exporter
MVLCFHFLLMIVFRSILVPLKAVLGFILSLMATLGFTTLRRARSRWQVRITIQL